MSLGLEMNTGNIDDGYAEAIVRALSKSFITREKYEELISASDLHEYKVLLEDTDYAFYLQSMDDQNIEPPELKRRMQEKLRDEIEYIMAQASQPLSSFLQMMMHSYQIDNVVSLLSVKKAGGSGQTGAVRQSAPAQASSMNPLGEFQGFEAIQKLAAMGETNVIELFQDILIDMPVGNYFRKYIDAIIQGASEADGSGGKVDMETIAGKIQTIGSAEQLVSIKKIWMTEFHKWTMANCNDSTREHMDELLKAEADWSTLQIAYNTMHANATAAAQ